MIASALRQDARARADRLRHAVQRIDAVPVMLRLISEQTQLRFSAVAYVTDELWIACAVHDELDFGLSPGSELPVETTLCLEERNQLAAIMIEHASVDPVCGLISLKSWLQTVMAHPACCSVSTQCEFTYPRG